MKPSKDDIDQLITDYAYSAQQYMKETGCVREADNIDPIWTRTDDICEAIGAPNCMWSVIRERMLGLGMPLALLYFGGYYLGKEGEQATILLHRRAMIKGLADGFNRDILMLAKSGSLDDAKDYATKRFGVELNDIPRMLRALGNPLPAQIEIALIETKI